MALRGGWLALPDEAALSGVRPGATTGAAARRLLAALSLPLLLPPGCLSADEIARLAAWAWFCDGLAVRYACALAPGAGAESGADVWRLACVAREVAGRLLLSCGGGAAARGAPAAPGDGSDSDGDGDGAAREPLTEISLLALPWAISSASAVGRAGVSPTASAAPSSRTGGPAAAGPGLQGAASFLLASGQCVRLLLGRASSQASTAAFACIWDALGGSRADVAAWADELDKKASDKAPGARALAVPRSVRLKMEPQKARRPSLGLALTAAAACAEPTILFPRANRADAMISPSQAEDHVSKPSVPLPSVSAACSLVLLSVALEAGAGADGGDGGSAASSAQAALLPLLPRLSHALLGRWAEQLASAASGAELPKGAAAAAPPLPDDRASLLSVAAAAAFASAAAALRAGLLPLEAADASAEPSPPASPDMIFRALPHFAAGGGAGSAASGGPAALVVSQAMALLEATLASALTGGWGDEASGVASFEAGFASLLTAARASAAAAARASGRVSADGSVGDDGQEEGGRPGAAAATAAEAIRSSGLLAFRGVCAVLSARQAERAVRGLATALVAAASQPPGRGGTAVASATVAADLLLALLQAQGAGFYSANSQQLQAAVVAAASALTAPQWDGSGADAGAALELSALRSVVRDGDTSPPSGTRVSHPLLSARKERAQELSSPGLLFPPLQVCSLCSAAASRPAFPLSTHALAAMLRLPAAIFGGDAAAAAAADAVRSGPFVPSCELLAVLLRHRSHQISRLLHAATPSLRGLVRSLLAASSAAPPPGPAPRRGAAGLDAAVAALSRVFEIAAQENVVNSKYCAYWLGDYVSECCAAGRPVVHRDALAPLTAAAVGLLAACGDNDLQHLHAALSSGSGGVRQLALGQLREEHKRTQYTGKV